MDDELIIRYAEPRNVSHIRAAVVGWWHWISELDPHEAGMVMWTNADRKHAEFSMRLMLGLVAIEPDILQKFKPKNTGTLAAVSAVVTEHYKAEFLKARRQGSG